MKKEIIVFLNTLNLILIFYAISLITNKEIDMLSVLYGLIIMLYVEFNLKGKDKNGNN